MKCFFVVAAILSFWRIRAQDSCAFYKGLSSLLGNEYHKFVVVSTFELWHFDTLPSAAIIARLKMDRETIYGLSKSTESLTKDSSSFCMSFLPCITRWDLAPIWLQNAEIRDNLDTATHVFIKRRANEFLKRRQYPRYNRFMATPIVVNYNKKLFDSVVYTIELTAPVFFKQYAAVEIANTAYGPWEQNSRTRLAFFVWGADVWKLIGYY